MLRARSYDESTGEWGDLFTRTYFYADSMETLKDRFSTYIVCLTSDPYNLYDYEYGIMVEGKIRDEYGEQPGIHFRKTDTACKLYPAGQRLGTGCLCGDSSLRMESASLPRMQECGSSGMPADSIITNPLSSMQGKPTEMIHIAYPFFEDNTHGADQKVQDAYKRLVVRAHGFDRV